MARLGFFILSIIPIVSFGVQAANIVKINDRNIHNYLTVDENTINFKNKDYTFIVKKINLANGLIKNKYTSYYQGVPIFNSLLSSSEKHGKQTQWYGNIIYNIEADIANTKPTISPNSALSLAKNKFHICPNDYIKNESTVIYIRLNEEHKAELIYLVSFNVEGFQVQRPYSLINAHTGEIIKSWDGLNTLKAEGPGGNEKTGKYYYGKDYGFLNVDAGATNTQCIMSNQNVEIYNMEHQTSGGTLFKFTCPVNNYTPINGAYSPLNDAHYFGTKILTMYKNWFSLTIFDRKLKIRVHYGYQQPQAYWDGQQMSIGDGDASLYPLTTIDVMGHEVSHAVTQKFSNLIYVGQSGAINESFSDMAGETAKFFVNQQFGKTNDWLMGASVMKDKNKSMRYFANPHLDGISIENALDYNDSVNVHAASGVFNKAFYTLATTQDWDIKKTFSIFLAANQTYWRPEETFESAACGVVAAAKDFNYNIQDVVDSFKTVGITVHCG